MGRGQRGTAVAGQPGERVGDAGRGGAGMLRWPEHPGRRGQRRERRRAGRSRSRRAGRLRDPSSELEYALDAEEDGAVGRVLRVVVVRQLGANHEVVVDLVGGRDRELGEARAVLQLLTAEAEGAGELGVEVVAVEREPVVALVAEAAVLGHVFEPQGRILRQRVAGPDVERGGSRRSCE